MATKREFPMNYGESMMMMTGTVIGLELAQAKCFWLSIDAACSVLRAQSGWMSICSGCTGSDMG